MTPGLGLVAVDANVLDRKGREQDPLVHRFLALIADATLDVIVSGSVRKEIEHSHTPGDVREAAALPHSLGVQKGLGAAQHISRIRVRAVMRGNAQPGKHEADAAHLSEAAEAGCSFFITHDGRMLRKRVDLEASLPRTLNILTLAEFLDRLDGLNPGSGHPEADG